MGKSKNIKALTNILEQIFSKGEARMISRLLVEHYFGLSATDLVGGRPLPDNYLEVLSPAIDRLKQHEPIQYILGFTTFYNRIFTVTPDVLIPRPETEELVDLIIKENRGKTGLKILDIGTGSGCIAITLAKELDAEVYGLDVSERALAVAKKNASSLGAKVSYVHEDVLNYELRITNDGTQVKKITPFPSGPFDIIVSNPPYVTEKEKQLMQPNVLNHEPHTALFVADHDPLRFYKIIGDLGLMNLKVGGKMYLEINEAYGQDTAGMLILKMFEKVQVRKDLNDKDRFVVATMTDR